MRVLSKTQTMEAYSMDKAILATEKAFSLYSDGKAKCPVRTCISTPHGTMLSMPAATSEACGCKMITVRPDNRNLNLPVIHALHMDLDELTGKVETLLNGNVLTQYRTGAVSGIAAKYLAKQVIDTIILIGCGVQGIAGLEAILTVRKCQKVIAFDIYPPSLKSVSEFCEKKQVTCEVYMMEKLEEFIHLGDIVLCTTTSVTPLFDGNKLKAGCTVSAVGSYQPHTREIDTATVTRSKVYVDTLAGVLEEAGDILIPIKEGNFSKDKIVGEIGQVINKTCEGRLNDEEIIVFKTVGTSIQDCIVGHEIALEAKRLNLGYVTQE